MSSRHRTVDSHSSTPSEKENDDNTKQIETNIDSSQDPTSVEPKIKSTGDIEQNPLQISVSIYFEPITRQKQNAFVELQQHYSEVFPSE